MTRNIKQNLSIWIFKLLLSHLVEFHFKLRHKMGTSGCVMVSRLDLQTFVSEFESDWVPHSYGLVPHLSKIPTKLL